MNESQTHPKQPSGQKRTKMGSSNFSKNISIFEKYFSKNIFRGIFRKIFFVILTTLQNIFWGNNLYFLKFENIFWGIFLERYIFVIVIFYKLANIARLFFEQYFLSRLESGFLLMCAIIDVYHISLCYTQWQHT